MLSSMNQEDTSTIKTSTDKPSSVQGSAQSGMGGPPSGDQNDKSKDQKVTHLFIHPVICLSIIHLRDFHQMPLRHLLAERSR